MFSSVRRLLGIGALTVGLLATGAPIASAVTPFAGPYPLFGSNCTQGTGDTSSAANGTTRGALTCSGEQDGRIQVFWTQGEVRATKASPWVGQVLATAWDSAARLFVLYRQDHSLKVGIVTDAGYFANAGTLSTSLPSSSQGTLVAAAGRYWAVWTENVGEQSELYQARTLRGSQGRTRITTNPAQDLEPKLVYTGGRVGLAWSRYASQLGSSDLWFARSTGGAWTAARMAAGGKYNNLPSLAGSGGAFYLAWTNDGRIQLRDNASGPWRGHSFGVRGHLSRVSVSGGKVFLAWETEEPGGIHVAQRDGSTWTGRTVLPRDVGLVGLTSGNGRATLVYRSINGVRSLVQ